jgi:hypothetical protein
MSEYRVPSISEFKQGFKFEVLRAKKGDHAGSAIKFDFSKDWTHTRTDVYHDEDKWQEITVWWDREPEMKTVGNTTYKELPEWDWQPWVREGYIEGLLKEGKIRVKK